MVPKEFEELYFPYDQVRPIQEDLIRRVAQAVQNSQNLVVHAPTGLGKTVAALAPSIREAIKKDLTVFFLTSRHTQHRLAMDTIKDIKNKFDLNFFCVDIIGKKWLCLQPDVTSLSPRDFSDYCQRMRDDDLCELYTNTKQKGEATDAAIRAIAELKSCGKTDTQNIIEIANRNKMCPYELAILVAKEAKVIIGDYYYIFHPNIRESFLKKIGKDLSKSIIIIDEGHNLPDRLKDLATNRISTYVIKRALEEAKKLGLDEIYRFVEELETRIILSAKGANPERYVTKSEILDELQSKFDYEELLAVIDKAADEIREDQKQSYLGSVSTFLMAWEKDAEGFTRILSRTTGLRGEDVLVLSYRCLDPSIITRSVIRDAYSTVLMSGTLTPTSMYREVLGFDSAVEDTFKSPFPEKNKLNIIVPKTSTKYETRSLQQYEDIAKLIARATNRVPGNSAVFFPSYYLKDEVEKFFGKLSEKTVFSEQPKFSKQDKHDFLEKFKQYKDSGAVLFGVSSGNFSEGVDLPGDLLKCVIIVGLPLQKPDLETEALIKYYDDKFKKGWDYGYLLPAFNKTLQSAGRCIRTETDKGVIMFIDERYAWKNYFRCFPSSWDLKVTLLYDRMIEEFFKNNR